MQNNDTNRRKKFYDQMSEAYDLGTFDEFNAKMDNAESREKLYKAIDGDGKYDIGSFDHFEEAMKPKEVKQPQTNVATAQAQPTDTTTVQQAVVAPAAMPEKDFGFTADSPSPLQPEKQEPYKMPLMFKPEQPADNRQWAAAQASAEQNMANPVGPNAASNTFQSMQQAGDAETARLQNRSQFDSKNFDQFYNEHVAPTFSQEKALSERKADEAVRDAQGSYMPGAGTGFAEGFRMAVAAEKNLDPEQVANNTIKRVQSDSSFGDYILGRMGINGAAQTDNDSPQLSEREQEWMNRLFAKETEEVANQITNRIYSQYQQENAPKSALEYIAGKAFHDNLASSLYKAMVRRAAGSSAIREQLRAMAYDEFGKDQGWMTRVAGGAAPFAVDMLSGGFALPNFVGQAAIKGGTKLAARELTKRMQARAAAKGLEGAALKEATSGAAGVAERYIATQAPIMNLALQTMGSAANFATYETQAEAVRQIAEGKFKPVDLIKEAVHGAMLGTAMGATGGIIGNLAKNASTLGKIGAGAAGIGAETGIFALDAGLQKAQADGVDIQDVDWADTAGEAFGTVIGMKGVGAVMHPRNFLNRYRKSKDYNLQLNQGDLNELKQAGYNLDDVFKGLGTFGDVTPMQGNTISKAKEITIGNYGKQHEVEDAWVDADNYEAIMRNPEISTSAKRKIAYIATGKILTPEPMFGVTMNVDENGKATVTTLNAKGDIIEAKEYNNEQEAQDAYAELQQAARTNTIGGLERIADKSGHPEVVDVAKGRTKDETGIDIDNLEQMAELKDEDVDKVMDAYIKNLQDAYMERFNENLERLGETAKSASLGTESSGIGTQSGSTGTEEPATMQRTDRRESAYQRGASVADDESSLQSIGHDQRVAEARLMQQMPDGSNTEAIRKNVMQAVEANDLDTAEQLLDQSKPYLNNSQIDALEQYLDAANTQSGIDDAVVQQAADYEERTRQKLQSIADEQGNITELQLRDGSTVYLVKGDLNNHYSAMIVTDGHGNNSQHLVSEIVDAGQTRSLDDVLAEQVNNFAEGLQHMYSQYANYGMLRNGQQVNMILSGQPVSAVVSGYDPFGNAVFTMEDGSQIALRPEEAQQAVMEADNASIQQQLAQEAESAKLAEQQERFGKGIKGYNEGQPDLTAAETDSKAAAEYLTMQANGDERVRKQQISDIENTKEQLTIRREEANRELNSINQWINGNEGIADAQEMEDAMRKRNELDATIKDIDQRLMKYGEIRRNLMTKEELAAMEQQRRKEIFNARTGYQPQVPQRETRTNQDGITEEDGVPNFGLTSVGNANNYLLRNYPDSYDAEQFITNERLKLRNKQRDEVQPEMNKRNDMLNAYADGTIDLSPDEVKQLVHEVADLEAQQNVLAQQAVRLREIADGIQSLYERNGQTEELTPAELRAKELDKAGSKEDKLRIARTLYKDYPEALDRINDQDPRDLDEFIAANLGLGSMNWEGINQGERHLLGVQEAVFGKRGATRGIGKGYTTNAFNHYLAPTGEGKDFNTIVHGIYEALPDVGDAKQWTTEDISNALINMLLTAQKPSDISHRIIDNRIAEAEEIVQHEEEYEREMEEMAKLEEMQAWADAYHLTPEERDEFEEFMKMAPTEPEIDIINNIIENEQDSRSNELDNQPINNGVGTEIEGGRGEILGQGEEQIGSNQGEQRPVAGGEAGAADEAATGDNVSGGAQERYEQAVDNMARIEEEWRDKLADYVSEHYPTQAVVSAENKSEKGIAEREAMKNDPVYQDMIRQAKEAVDAADKEIMKILNEQEEHIKNIKKAAEAHQKKYRTLAPLEVLSINSDDDLRKIAGDEYKEFRKYLKESKLPACYDTDTKKIYIFAENIDEADVELGIFHESFHRGLEQYYGDGLREVAEAFWETESPTNPEKSREGKKATAEAYKDHPQDIKEEYLTLLMGLHMSKGTVDKILARLSPEHQEIVNNILINIGYDREQEKARRTGELHEKAEGRQDSRNQESSSDRGGVEEPGEEKGLNQQESKTKLSSIQGLENYSGAEIADLVKNHFNSLVGEDGIEIVDMSIIGSRVNGKANEDSDLDVLLEYKGNMKEDALFNILNDEEDRLYIEGIPVDINPIRKGDSGTIQEFLERNADYDTDRDKRNIPFAARLAKAISETNTNPTEAQKEAGNYRKPELKFGGYTFRIENPKGSIRSGVDRNGREWSQEMHDTYGFIEEKVGKDGDKMDFFINDDADLDAWDGRVYVVDQKNEDGTFDEHKVMYGYPNLRSAREAYKRNYEDGWYDKHVMKITGVRKAEFDKWLSDSDHKIKPFSEYYRTKMLKDVVDDDFDQLISDVKERLQQIPEMDSQYTDEQVSKMDINTLSQLIKKSQADGSTNRYLLANTKLDPASEKADTLRRNIAQSEADIKKLSAALDNLKKEFKLRAENAEAGGAIIDHLQDMGVDVTADTTANRKVYKQAEKDNSQEGKLHHMRTPDGTVYGFTYKGKIYLDPHKMDANRPLHEYGHLWADAFRRLNPEGWKDVVSVMKQDADTWQFVKSINPDLQSDSDIAEEMIAKGSGEKGEERVRAEFERMAQRDPSYKGKWNNIWKNISKAIQDFWKQIGDFLGIKYKTPAQVYDQVLKDFANGVNPRKKVEEYLKQRDAEYAEAVKSGNTSRATQIFNEALKENVGNGMTPYVAVDKYRKMQSLAHKIKDGDAEGIRKAAQLMSELIPENAVLIPAPSHKGKATTMLQLAEAIAERTGSEVADILESSPRASQYTAKKQGGKAIAAKDMGIKVNGQLPEGKVPVIIDNVVDTGNTAEACVQALGTGIVASLADSTEFGKRVATLRSAAPIIANKQGEIVPLSERFDLSRRETARPVADVTTLMDDVEQRNETARNEQQLQAAILSDKETQQYDKRSSKVRQRATDAVLTALDDTKVPVRKVSRQEADQMMQLFTSMNIQAITEMARSMQPNSHRRYAVIDVRDPFSVPKYFEKRSYANEFKIWANKSGRLYELIDLGRNDANQDAVLRDAADIMPEIQTWHGSGAVFTKFDHSHMSEGAGSQAFGWGTYLSDSKRIGEDYASMVNKGWAYQGKYLNDIKPIHDGKNHKSEVVRDILSGMNHGYTLDEEKEKVIRFVESSIRDYEDEINYLSEADKEDLKDLREILDFVREIKPQDFEKSPENLYKVEIPEDNGTNYLEYKKPVGEKLAKEIRDFLYNHVMDSADKGVYKNMDKDVIRQDIDRVIEPESNMPWLQRALDARGVTLEEFSKWLSQKGYVGIKYPAGTIYGGGDGATNYVIFNEDDAKIVEHIQFMVETPESAPVFYSNALKAVEAIRQEKGTPDQWLAMIQKNGGLKAGEDKWLGLSDWLNEQKQAGKSVTKQEVMDYIRQNQIQVEEVPYREFFNMDDNPKMKEFRKEFDDLREKYYDEANKAWRDTENFNQEMNAKYGYGWANKLDEADQKRSDEITERYKKYVNESPSTLAFQEMVDNYGDDFEQGFYVDYGSDSLEPNSDMYDEGISDAAKHFLELNEQPINDTRLNYTTAGLDNKREIAITVPTIEPYNANDEIHFGDAGEGRAVVWVRFGDATAPIKEDVVKHADEFEAPYNNGRGNTLYYPKGTKPGWSKDYIVHGKDKDGKDFYRVVIAEATIGVYDNFKEAQKNMNLYFQNHPKQQTTGTQKVLVIDEIQSKRHQDAREKGYSNANDIPKKHGWTIIDDPYNPKIFNSNGDRLTRNPDMVGQKDGDHTFVLATEDEWRDISEYFTRKRHGIPDAPFEKNWHEVAMKRMLRYAAEHGYDKIAWTTGAQQAERYSLSNIVKSIEVGNWGEDVNGDKLEVEQGYKGKSNWVPENDVEKAIKDYIEYCMENGDTFSMSVAYANNQITDAPNESKGWTYDAVLKVADAIEADLTGYKDARGVVINVGDDLIGMSVNRDGKILDSSTTDFVGKSLADVVGKEVALMIVGKEGKGKVDAGDLAIGGEGMKGFYDEILPRFMNKYGKKWGVKVGEINLPNLEESAQKMWSIDVTPDMRNSVMQGQPMFQKSRGGRVYGWTDGTGIFLTPDGLNPNTPIHEYTHIWDAYVQKHDPELWKEMVSVFKQTDMWQQIRENPNYRAIWDDDNRMASEVHSRLSGQSGEQKFTEAAQDETKNSRGIINNVKNVLKKFWESIAKLFGYGKKATDRLAEFVNMPLRDLLTKKFNPIEGGATTAMPMSGETIEKTLMGVHNISEEKLKKAIKLGGLANPSLAVIDTKNGIHTDYGEISLIPRSSMIDAKTGRNAGTYAGDAWTPTYPSVTRELTTKGEKHVNKMAKDAAGGNTELEQHLARTMETYIEDNNNRLHLLYLLQKGIKPELIPETTSHSHEEYEELKKILGNDQLRYSSDGLTKEQNDAILEMMMKGVREKAEQQAKLITDEEKRQKAIDAVIKLRKDSLVDPETGNIWFAKYDTFIHDVWRDEKRRQNPKIDWYKTDNEASYRVAKENLAEDYDAWKEQLFADGDINEKLFAGWTEDGNKKYLKNTVANASRLMNKEADTNAYGNGGMSASKAKLVKNLKSLADIRKNRYLLKVGDEAQALLKQKNDEWFDIIHQVSEMQKIDSNPYINIDIAEARLQEAMEQRDPIAYMNKEYGYHIDKDSKLASQLMNFMEEASELPVKYFETKFKRPVGIEEFAVAVVPTTTSPEVVKALEDAGLEVRTYEKGDTGDEKDENRKAAVLNAVHGRNDILFHTDMAGESSVKSWRQGELFSDDDFLPEPKGKKSNRIKDMSDEELLKAIADREGAERRTFIDIFDQRHIQDHEDAYNGYLDILNFSESSLEDAYQMYDNVWKEWKDGGYATSDRTRLLAQIDALEDFIQNKEEEQRELERQEEEEAAQLQKEQEQFEKQKEEVRQTGYDLTQIRFRALEPGETCHVERRYTENKMFSFTGTDHIESIDDVAYIFRQLENKSVENTFVVLEKDGVPTVIHLAIGDFTSSQAPMMNVFAAYNELNPEHVWFVHNHPSGRIEASKQDKELMLSFRRVFGDKLLNGIIINTTSGKYGVFNELAQIGNRERPTSAKNETPIKVYSFDQQVFDKDWNPETAFDSLTPTSIAKFISSHRLGEHKKMSLLVMDTAGHITGNIFLPWTNLKDAAKPTNAMQIATYVTQMGGGRCVIYGNYDVKNERNENSAAVRLKNMLKNHRVTLMDMIHMGANDTHYNSMHEKGVMEPESTSLFVGEPVTDYNEIARLEAGDSGNTELAKAISGKLTLAEINEAMNSKSVKAWLNRNNPKSAPYGMFGGGDDILRALAKARLGITNKYGVTGQVFYNAGEEIESIIDYAREHGLDKDIADKHDFKKGETWQQLVDSDKPVFTDKEVEAILKAVPLNGAEEALRGAIQAFADEKNIREEIEYLKNYDNGNAYTKALALRYIAMKRLREQYEGDERFFRPVAQLQSPDPTRNNMDISNQPDFELREGETKKTGYAFKKGIKDDILRIIATTPVSGSKLALEDGNNKMYRRNNPVIRAINDRYNEQLKSLNANTIFNLGNPAAVLVASGIENKPLRLYGNKLLAKLEKHGYAPEDVRDLPIAVHNPIAIFSGSHPGSFAILTELDIKGNKVLVTLSAGKGGSDVDFNVVSSVYDKKNNSIFNWINQQKGLYYDKAKALDYLRHSAPIAETTESKALDSAAKIVNDFENPNISEENLRNIYAKEVRVAEETADLLGGEKIVFEAEANEDGALGWYDPKDGSIHVVLPAHADAEDVQRTVCHEKLGHEGLVALLGSQKEVDKFGHFVLRSANADLKKRIIAKADEIDSEWKDPLRYSHAAQEVIADIAADGPRTADEFSLWRKIKHYLIRFLNKLGLRIRGLLNDHDLSYYILKTGEALKKWNGMTDAQKREAAQQGYDTMYNRGKGKPRKRNNESMAQYLQRLREWERWKIAEQQARDNNDPMPTIDEVNAKWEEKYNNDLAEWKQRNNITGNMEAVGEFPKRKPNETPQEYAMRVADYETQKDIWREAPSLFDYLNQANREYRDAYRAWRERYGIREAENVDLGLYEGDPDSMPHIVDPEDLEAENRADAELAEAVGIDMSSEGAKRHTKLAVIERRKNLESANAEDAIWIHNLVKRLDEEAKRQGVSAKELRKNMADIIEGTYFEDVLRDENGNVVSIVDISDQLPIKMTDSLKEILSDIKDWYDYFYHQLEDAGLRGEAGYVEEGYVNHVWSREKSNPSAWEKYIENFQRTKSPNMRERIFQDYRSGEEVGLVRKFDDIAQIIAYYSSSNNQAIANKKFLDALSFVVVEETNSDGEVTQVLPLLNSQKPDAFTADRYDIYKVPGVGDVWVIKDIQRTFSNVFGTMRTKDVADWVSKFGRTYDIVSSTAKKIQLSFSAFHMGALTEVAMAQMRPDRAAKALAQYIIFDCAKKGTIPAYAHPEDFKFAASHLVQLGATQDYSAADVNNLTEKFRDVVRELANDENLAKKGTGYAVTPVAAALDYINKGMDKVLWNYLHDGLKIACFKMFAEQIDKRVVKEALTPEQREQLLDEAGQYVNDTFGGQYWELLNVSPSTVKWLRRAFLSPDWLISTQRHFLANFGFGSLYSESGFLNYLRYNADNIKRVFGVDVPKDENRRFRSSNAKKCYILGVCGFFYVMMNALNAFFRAQDEEKEKAKADEIRKTNPDYKSGYELAYPDGMKWYDYTMYGNTVGQQTHLFLGRYNDGTEWYARWGKQFREFPELFMGRHGVEFPTPLMERMSGKANPVGRYLLYDLPLTVGMYGYRQPRETQEIADKYGNTVALLAMTAKKFLPFSVPTQEDKEFKLFDLVMPSQKGFTQWKAMDYFKTYIEAGDMDGVQRTYNAAVMNGLDAERALKGAIASVKATQRKELSDGVDDLQTAMERFDAAKDTNERKLMKRKILKYLAEQNYKAFTRDEAREQVESFLNGDQPTETENTKYLELQTSADVRNDYRISALKKKAKKYVDEIMEAEGDKQKALIKGYRHWFQIQRIIRESDNATNRLKKQLGKGKDDAAIMQQIRDIKSQTQKQVDAIVR